MSESLKSWLFAFCTSSSSHALDTGLDLYDIPFSPGNRIQLLRFLTFRPPSSPNSTSTDVWALVGDRTHCIAARFNRLQVDRFHMEHPLSFTSLKGALVTLTNVRVTVARVQLEPSSAEGSCSTRGGPYRANQYALVLDVRGFEVVSSMGEPVWFGGVKLVTSPNGVPRGAEEGAEKMLRWMKKWIRYKSLLRRAKLGRVADVPAPPAPSAEAAASSSGSGGLPTPAQRRNVLVLNSSQALNTPPQKRAEGKGKEESQESQSQSQALPPLSSEKTELWRGFDLDVIQAELDEEARWGVGAAAGAEAEVVEESRPGRSVEGTQEAEVAGQSSLVKGTQDETQEQEGGAEEDEDESGLSDYERESRRRRRGKGGGEAGCTHSKEQPQEGRLEEPSHNDDETSAKTGEESPKARSQNVSAVDTCASSKAAFAQLAAAYIDDHIDRDNRLPEALGPSKTDSTSATVEHALPNRGAERFNAEAFFLGTTAEKEGAADELPTASRSPPPPAMQISPAKAAAHALIAEKEAMMRNQTLTPAELETLVRSSSVSTTASNETKSGKKRKRNQSAIAAL